MFSRRASSEFPNDNPELHDGLVWACPAPLGRALPTLRLREQSGTLPRVLGPSWEALPVAMPAAPLHEPYVAVDSSSTPLEAVTEPDAPLEAVTEPDAPSDPFVTFVSVLARIALTRGATRAAAGLTALCENGRVAPGALDEGSLRELIARRVVAPSGTHATAEFRAALDAWRGVLDGSAGDLSACGANTLDAWAADLLAAALNAPNGAVPELRRELRRAGVAAFGLLAVA